MDPTTAHPSIRQQLGALVVAGASVGLLVAGAPGLDFLESSPEHATGFLATVLRWDRVVRLPIVKPLEPIEGALGVRQLWQFYGTGPSRHRRFEIFVDGERWFAVNDGADRFLAEPFANPRLRHLMKNWVKGRGGRYEQGLLQFIAHHVRLEKPTAQLVEIVATEARYPDRGRKELRRARLPL